MSPTKKKGVKGQCFEKGGAPGKYGNLKKEKRGIKKKNEVD